MLLKLVTGAVSLNLWFEYFGVNTKILHIETHQAWILHFGYGSMVSSVFYIVSNIYRVMKDKNRCFAELQHKCLITD